MEPQAPIPTPPRFSPEGSVGTARGSLAPIPTPPAQRWREFRIQALPVITFLGILVCVVVMWRQYVLPTNIVGEVESVRATVISSVEGTIKELKVKRFQRVAVGEEIAVISTMDAETLQTALRAIETDLKVMRARMDLDVQRNEQSYQQTRLDFLKRRVDLAIERVNAEIYEAEVGRQYQMLTNTPPLTSLTDYDAARRLALAARTNVVESEQFLAENERTLAKLLPANQAEQAVAEAITAKEEEMRATSRTISLKSPIDGMVSLVGFYQGQKVVRNSPIATISATSATRIVGYVRKPFSEIPKQGDLVTIRRQTFKREIAQGVVLEVSGQLEQITPTLVPPTPGVKIELGLPFAVSIPTELLLIPGEPVDLIFAPK
jgi:multidrug resistance efflux pump